MPVFAWVLYVLSCICVGITRRKIPFFVYLDSVAITICVIVCIINKAWLEIFLLFLVDFCIYGLFGLFLRKKTYVAPSSPATASATSKNSTAGKTVLIVFVILAVLFCAAGISFSDIFGHYQAGYDSGYDAGHDDGYAEGRRIGINIGKASGYRDGEADGFLKGQIDYMIRQNSLTKAQKFADECGMRFYFLDRMVYYGHDISHW